MHPFLKANILLPKDAAMEKWSVIACDQFASQPEYWDEARHLAADAPSALHLILFLILLVIAAVAAGGIGAVMRNVFG